MNNLLENKIKAHAEEIFGNEPLKGHRERFAEKLAASKRRKRVSIYRIAGYVSIAAVFAGCVLLLYHTLNPEYLQEGEPLSEVQNYYSMQLQEKVDNIEQLLQRVNENDRADLISDIENLQKEAETEIAGSGEKNVEFIVMTYTTKIEAIAHIQSLLAENL